MAYVPTPEEQIARTKERHDQPRRRNYPEAFVWWLISHVEDSNDDRDAEDRPRAVWNHAQIAELYTIWSNV